MTIAIDSALASTLASAGTENNPFFGWFNRGANSGTHTTGVGTAVNAAAMAYTGTTYDAWIATPSSGNASLQTVFASGAASLTFGAIAAHNLGTIGATVALQYSTNGGSTWNDCGSGSVSPSDDRAIGFYFAAETADRWRFLVTGAGSSDVEIAVAFLGNQMTVPSRIYQGYRPSLTPTNIGLQSNVSEGGNLLGSAVVRKGSMAQASFAHVPPSFLRGATWLGFQEHFNAGGGVFWAWRPTKYGDLHYAWRDGPAVAPVNSGPNDLMSADLSMRLYDTP